VTVQLVLGRKQNNFLRCQAFSSKALAYGISFFSNPNFPSRTELSRWQCYWWPTKTGFDRRRASGLCEAFSPSLLFALEAHCVQSFHQNIWDLKAYSISCTVLGAKGRVQFLYIWTFDIYLQVSTRESLVLVFKTQDKGSDGFGPTRSKRAVATICSMFCFGRSARILQPKWQPKCQPNRRQAEVSIGCREFRTQPCERFYFPVCESTNKI